MLAYINSVVWDHSVWIRTFQKDVHFNKTYISKRRTFQQDVHFKKTYISTRHTFQQDVHFNKETYLHETWLIVNWFAWQLFKFVCMTYLCLEIRFIGFVLGYFIDPSDSQKQFTWIVSGICKDDLQVLFARIGYTILFPWQPMHSFASITYIVSVPW